MTNLWVRHLLGIFGAAVGAALGHVVFLWLVQRGFYAMMLPGALLGLGCGLASQIHSKLLGILCLVAGLALGIFTEWRHAPFVADDSLVFFVSHLLDLQLMTLIMIGLGGACAFWMGTGRRRLSP